MTRIFRSLFLSLHHVRERFYQRFPQELIFFCSARHDEQKALCEDCQGPFRFVSLAPKEFQFQSKETNLWLHRSYFFILKIGTIKKDMLIPGINARNRMRRVQKVRISNHSVKDKKVEKICYCSNESFVKMVDAYGDGTRPGDYGFLPDLVDYFSNVIN